MKYLVKREGAYLIPVYNSDAEAQRDCKLKQGQVYEVEIKKKRNIDHHRKYFALVNLCYENQEQFEDIETLRWWLTCKAGYYKRVETPKGEMIIPKSISFSKMDQVDFDKYYSLVLDVVCKFLNTDSEIIIGELSEFM